MNIQSLRGLRSQIENSSNFLWGWDERNARSITPDEERKSALEEVDFALALLKNGRKVGKLRVQNMQMYSEQVELPYPDHSEYSKQAWQEFTQKWRW